MRDSSEKNRLRRLTHLIRSVASHRTWYMSRSLIGTINSICMDVGTLPTLVAKAVGNVSSQKILLHNDMKSRHLW